MTTIFAPSAIRVNKTFGLGLFPQVDNTLPRHPADAASIDEQTAYSISRTQLEESRDAIMDRIRQADIEAELEWQAEVAEMGARMDAICFA
jgi:hypothetical protein